MKTAPPVNHALFASAMELRGPLAHSAPPLDGTYRLHAAADVASGAWGAPAPSAPPAPPAPEGAGAALKASSAQFPYISHVSQVKCMSCPLMATAPPLTPRLWRTVTELSHALPLITSDRAGPPDATDMAASASPSVALLPALVSIAFCKTML